jgi:hypothetical protein
LVDLGILARHVGGQLFQNGSLARRDERRDNHFGSNEIDDFHTGVTTLTRSPPAQSPTAAIIT